MPGTSISIAPIKPAYVTFETRAVEDRAASLEQSRYVTKDVDFAVVTPPGSKDRIDRRLPDWFEQLAVEVQQERYPAEWLAHYRLRYKEWKQGHEMPLDGTSVRQWNVLSPSQVNTLIGIGVVTIEQMAEANEEVIARLGMGGRALKEQARKFLQTANDLGAQAARIAELEAKLAGALETIEKLQTKPAAHAANVAAAKDELKK